MSTFRTTLLELSKTLNMEKSKVYGFVRFLEARGLIKVVGIEYSPYGKSRGTHIYDIPETIIIPLKDTHS